MLHLFCWCRLLWEHLDGWENMFWTIYFTERFLIVPPLLSALPPALTDVWLIVSKKVHFGQLIWTLKTRQWLLQQNQPHNAPKWTMSVCAWNIGTCWASTLNVWGWTDWGALRHSCQKEFGAITNEIAHPAGDSGLTFWREGDHHPP